MYLDPQGNSCNEETVKRGSNVFKTPAAFPPNFCRVAAAQLGQRLTIGRRRIIMIAERIRIKVAIAIVTIIAIMVSSTRVSLL